MKKKIVTIALIVAIMAVSVIGGTLAYFQDTAKAVNTFTIGNVAIDLIEKGEDNKTDFVQDQKLIPGQSNAVAKRVWVENTGDSDAWVWVKIYIPAALDTSADASANDLHMNTYGQFESEYFDETWASAYSQTPITDGILNENHKPIIANMVAAEEANTWTLIAREENVTVNEVAYNVYTYAMTTQLPSDAVSLPVLRQVYMDAGVKQCTESGHENCLVLKDGTHYTGSWELIVEAYAIQDDGFETVEAAKAAYDAQD